MRSLAYNRTNNLLVRKDRVTIACYVKWEYEEISSCNLEIVSLRKVALQEDFLTQELPVVDSNLSNVSFFLQKTDTDYKELDLRQ